VFPVRQLLQVEMIRDGGSLAATFEIEGGRKFILYIPIAETMRVWREPVLIDPEKRVTTSDLSGDFVPVPWAQARQVLAEMATLSSPLDALQSDWLRLMSEVAEYEGRMRAALKD
jgi:hypothetical protein